MCKSFCPDEDRSTHRTGEPVRQPEEGAQGAELHCCGRKRYVQGNHMAPVVAQDVPPAGIGIVHRLQRPDPTTAMMLSTTSRELVQRKANRQVCSPNIREARSWTPHKQQHASNPTMETVLGPGAGKGRINPNGPVLILSEAVVCRCYSAGCHNCMHFKSAISKAISAEFCILQSDCRSHNMKQTIYGQVPTTLCNIVKLCCSERLPRVPTLKGEFVI